MEQDQESRRVPEVGSEDVLNHETLSLHFMEFMEMYAGKDGRKLLDYWLMVSNLNRASGSNDGIHQNDAMIVYEKFISIQATSPLGFSDDVRSVHSSCFYSPSIAAYFIESYFIESRFISSATECRGDSRIFGLRQ